MAKIFTQDEARKIQDDFKVFMFDHCKRSMIGELNCFLSSHPKGGKYLYSSVMYKKEMADAANHIVVKLINSGWYVWHKSVNRYRMYGVIFHINAKPFESMSMWEKFIWWLKAEE